LLALEGVSDVRGRGLMLGVALEEGIEAPALRDDLLERGLIVNAPEPETIRLLPPLVIDESDVERAVAAFSESCARLYTPA
jgi:acetylornithine/N-succinyldiaminopimelate aminotransferase